MTPSSLRAGIPPFYVMDVWLAAAERQRTHGDLVNLSAGQPSAGAPAPVRDGRGRGARPQPARLHRGARNPGTARGDRRLVPGPARPRGRSARRRRDDGLVRRVPVGVPRVLRRRRPGRRSPAPDTRATATSCRRSAARSWSCRAGPRPGSSRRCRCWPSSTRRSPG